MLKTRAEVWQELQQHQQQLQDCKLLDLFANDANRFNKFVVRDDDILLD